jgi:hypothetical protein
MYESSYFCHHIDNIETNDEIDIIFCNKISINNNSLCPNHQNEKDMINQNKKINKDFFLAKIKSLLYECEYKLFKKYDKAKKAKQLYEYILGNPIFLIDSPTFMQIIFNKLNEFINNQINDPHPFDIAQFNTLDYLKKIKSKLGILDEKNNIELDNKCNNIELDDKCNNIELDDKYINDIDGSKIMIEL